jgi:hypothetical protein
LVFNCRKFIFDFFVCRCCVFIGVSSLHLFEIFLQLTGNLIAQNAESIGKIKNASFVISPLT